MDWLILGSNPGLAIFVSFFCPKRNKKLNKKMMQKGSNSANFPAQMRKKMSLGTFLWYGKSILGWFWLYLYKKVWGLLWATFERSFFMFSWAKNKFKIFLKTFLGPPVPYILELKIVGFLASALWSRETRRFLDPYYISTQCCRKVKNFGGASSNWWGVCSIRGDLFYYYEINSSRLNR